MIWLAAFIFIMGGVSAKAEPESLAYKHGSWPKSELVVCFGDQAHVHLTAFSEGAKDSDDPITVNIGSVPEAYRKVIKAAIMREFTPDRTHIHFGGWENCTPNAEAADVVLFMSKEDLKESLTFGWASIGQNLDTAALDDKNEIKNIEKKAFVYLRNPEAQNLHDYHYPYQTTKEETLELTSIHEFGHVVGLAHEDDRIYSGEQDRNCLLTDGYYSERVVNAFPETLGENVEVSGVYDSNSIMNYCWLNGLKTITGTTFIQDSSLPIFVPGAPIEIAENVTGEKRKIADRPIKNTNGILPPQSLFLTDSSLYSEEILSSNKTQIKLKVGLSAGDVHAIRCLYRYEEENRDQVCRLSALPNSQNSLIAPLKSSF